MFGVSPLFLADGFEPCGRMKGAAAETQVIPCVFQARSREAPTFEEESASFRIKHKIQPGICQAGHLVYHLSRISLNGIGPSRSSFGSLPMQSMIVEA